jgi:hypothetical protein
VNHPDTNSAPVAPESIVVDATTCVGVAVNAPDHAPVEPLKDGVPHHIPVRLILSPTAVLVAKLLLRIRNLQRVGATGKVKPVRITASLAPVYAPAEPSPLNARIVRRVLVGLDAPTNDWLDGVVTYLPWLKARLVCAHDWEPVSITIPAVGVSKTQFVFM